jgi:hypothetical protein
LIFAIPCLIPILTITLNDLGGSGVAIMIVNILIPGAIVGWCTTGGVWDLLVYKLTCGKPEEPKEEEDMELTAKVRESIQ